MSRRHLVTGAAGVIGFELVRQLCEAGDTVVAVDIGIKGGLADLEKLAREHAGRLKLLNVDVARGLGKIADEPRFDAVFHLAAIVGVKYVTDHPYETLDVNLRSTLNVLDRAIADKTRAVVFASSSENYASTVDAGHASVPTPESVTLSIDDIALPRWSYAASKIAGESAVFGAARLGGFAPLVIRFHNVYGPRMGPTHVIPEFLVRCRERVDPFPVYGPEQTRSFLYVEDAARALRLVLDAGLAAPATNGGIYNVGTGVETRISDLAELVFGVTGHHPRVDSKPAPPGSVARRVPDVTKLAKLGFKPSVSLEDGLRRCWRAGVA
jgi:UDP-glucose 4-epimerase/UDP-glucuronate decarboxylase